MIFDAHSHSLYRNYGAVVLNATSENEWESILSLSSQNENIYSSLGVHPWFLDTLQEGWQERLETLIKNSLAFVGECGLDFIRNKGNKELQEEVFSFQLGLAVNCNRPISIHCIKAWDSFFRIVQEVGVPQCGGLLHGYGGSAQMVKRLESLGFYFSFGKDLCEERFKKKREAVKDVSLDRLLLESDSMKEGSFGGEEYLRIVSEVALLKGIEEEVILKVIERNFLRFFGK